MVQVQIFAQFGILLMVIVGLSAWAMYRTKRDRQAETTKSDQFKLPIASSGSRR